MIWLGAGICGFTKDPCTPYQDGVNGLYGSKRPLWPENRWSVWSGIARQLKSGIGDHFFRIAQITIKIENNDYGAEELESRVISPIREKLQQLTGMVKLESESENGKGMIKIRFVDNSDGALNFIKVNEKLDFAMNSLPRDIERPNVVKTEVSDIPVFKLSIYPKENTENSLNLESVSDLARQIISKRIEQLPEVAMADATGYFQRVIEILPKKNVFHALNIEPDVLAQSIRDNRLVLSNILVKSGEFHYYLKFSSEVQDIQNLRNALINVGGRIFKLEDLAEVQYGLKSETGAYYFNGHKAINFAIIKQNGAKMDDLKRNFGQLLESLQRDYPSLNFKVSEDQTKLLDYSIRNLGQDLVLGGFIAFIAMLIFVRKLVPAALIAFTIPVSLVFSQLGFYFFGMSLNVISLGGLILGLAMIIDNSIVVIDNVNRFLNLGLDIRDATVEGTNEVIRPLITSMLTNCAVFVPLIYISGIAGALFYDQAISIVLGVISSLVVTIGLLPCLYVFIYPKIPERIRGLELPALVNVTGWYERILALVFKFQLATLILVIILFASTITLVSFMKKEKMPPLTRYDGNAIVDWNQNIGIERNEKQTLQLFSHIKGLMESSMIIGEPQYVQPQKYDLGKIRAKIYFKIADPEKLEDIKIQISRYLKSFYPEAIVSFMNAGNAFDEIFDEQAPSLRFEISKKDSYEMPDIDSLRLLVNELRNNMPNCLINEVNVQKKISIKPKALAFQTYNLRPKELSDRISYLFKQNIVDSYQEGGTLIPIFITENKFSDINQILRNNLMTLKNGNQLPLDRFVELYLVEDYQTISSSIRGRYYPINIYTDNPAKDLPIAKKIVKKYSNVFSNRVTGAYFDNYKLLKEMTFVLIVSVLLLFFILAAQFESLLQPIFILVEIPLALFGALLILWVSGSGLNVMSMIGIVIMSGLIINDSILKIDSINQLRVNGMVLMEAIIEGGHRRLKPIVMITLTSIGSLCPTIFMTDLGSELQKPLAFSLIGGMFVGVFISLFFIPLVYWHVYNLKFKHRP